jgi:SAM-dependent methyltransferase
MTASEQTTAAAEGPAWSAGASGWVEYWAGFAAPAREALARAAGIEAGASVLDVGCGSGEFCELAAARGARVSGIDAAEGMVEFARRKLPGADLRVGPIEELPWPEDSFDPLGEPGVLEDLARKAGLTPERADEVEVPFAFSDQPTLEHALRAIAPVYGIAPPLAEPVVRRTVEAAAKPYRRPDGSYRFENRFRYLIAVAS